MKELTLEAKVENISTVTDFVNAALEAWHCSMKVQMQIAVAIDEMFCNIARYAYPAGTGSATVQVELEKEPPAVVVTFIDRGTPFNPLDKPDPDITLTAEERAAGGLGIFLVKKTMDDMSYEYRNGLNILRIKKGLIDRNRKRKDR